MICNYENLKEILGQVNCKITENPQPSFTFTNLKNLHPRLTCS